LFEPLRPILSGKAAFSSKNSLVFFKQYSDAGAVAGVFFDRRCSAAAPRKRSMMAEVLHKRGDAAVQLEPNSLAQTTVCLRR
jgi:hypothetical protein